MFRGVVYVVGHSACEKRLLAFRSPVPFDASSFARVVGRRARAKGG